MNNKSRLWGYVGASLLFLSASSAHAAISGKVFRDFNGNGTQESAEPLVAGVEVKAFSNSGSQCGTTQTTTSASAPNYSLAGCTGAVRVEFSIPQTGCQISSNTDYSALGGDAYGSSVQFLSDGASGTANFALQNPGEYGGGDTYVPKLFNIAMRAGDPIPSPTPPAGDDTYTANQSTILSTGYFENGPVFTGDADYSASTEATRQIGHTVLANAGQTGTLWGNAYSPQAKRLFVSAFLRRHAGMGPLGSGGIYMLDPASPNLTTSIGFVSLDNLGIPTHAASGAMHIRTNTEREMPAQPYNVPTHDVEAFDQVGKTSLGDLDISSDGRYLFVVNLYDRKLYRLDLQNAASPVVPTAAQVSSYAIPDDCTASGGEYRPFGLKVFRNKLYVGSICSGENASGTVVGTSADMKLYVYEYDEASLSTAPTTVYNQTLAYRDSDSLQFSNYGQAAWQAWNNDFYAGDGGEGRITINEPMLTDIEFDNKGNMLVGLTDRNSYQVGSRNFGTDTSNTTDSYLKIYANGDILKLKKGADCSFTPVSGSYDDNDFYNDNARWGTVASACYNQATCHQEISLGAMTTHRFGDKDEVVSIALNPVAALSNGYIAWNNEDGSQQRANEIWYDPYWYDNPSTNFGKGGGLGDMETLEVTSPIEIGNRVWLDTNGDGIQDAGEAGISGVDVELRDAGGSLIATVTTAADGTYYFTNATGTDVTGKKYGVTQLQPNTAYTLHFPTTTTVSSTSYSLTAVKSGSNTLIDSDAAVATGDVVIAATDIPVNGATNHSFDVGYGSSPLVDLELNKIADKTAVHSGDVVRYTITVTNKGPGAASNVEVTDQLPAGVTYKPTYTVSQGTYTPATGIWAVGSLANGASATLTIDVTVN